MNYLVMDTSGAHLAVAVRRGDEVFTHYDHDCALKHSLTLMSAVESLLTQAGLTPDKLDFIGAVVGPGSFTGIRIGVATAKAMCLAANVSCLAITSFDVLAYNGKKTDKLTVIDAGHGGYYVCDYTGLTAGRAQYVLKDEMLGLSRGREIICPPDTAGLECEYADLMTGLVAAADDMGEQAGDPDMIDPLYVRKSQAEEGRK